MYFLFRTCIVSMLFCAVILFVFFTPLIPVQASQTVFAWGRNDNGQLGIGTNTNTLSPTTHPTITGITQYEGSASHSIWKTKTNTIFGAGKNQRGQVADGTFSERSTAAQISLSNVVKIESGDSSTFAITSTGQLYAWGYNADGQLGIGTNLDVNVPTLVSSLSNVIDVSHRNFHTLVLTSNGNVYAMGRNNYGQLGIGGIVSQNTPQLITTLSGLGIAKIFAQTEYSYAITSTGQLYAWGRNSSGRLGLGNAAQRYETPTIHSTTGVDSIYSGLDTTLALLTNGTVVGWGNNAYGRLGQGNTTRYTSPVTVTGLSNIVRITGSENNYNAIHFQRSDGVIFGVGRNDFGQLGLGNVTSPITTATEVTGIPSVARVYTSDTNSAFRSTTGLVYTTGEGTFGSLGRGNTNNVSTYTLVPSVTSVTELYMQDWSIMAVTGVFCDIYDVSAAISDTYTIRRATQSYSFSISTSNSNMSSNALSGYTASFTLNTTYIDVSTIQATVSTGSLSALSPPSISGSQYTYTAQVTNITISPGALHTITVSGMVLKQGAPHNTDFTISTTLSQMQSPEPSCNPITEANTANNTASDTTTYSQGADLSISTTSTGGANSTTNTIGLIVAGRTVSYTSIVTNAGAETVTNPVVTYVFTNRHIPQLANGSNYTNSANTTCSLTNSVTMTCTYSGTLAQNQSFSIVTLYATTP